MKPSIENAVADVLLAIVHTRESIGHDDRARRILRGIQPVTVGPIPRRPVKHPARCNVTRRAIQEGLA